MPPKRGKRTLVLKAEPESVADDVSSTTKDWTKFTVTELREACNERSIDSTGTKAALIKKLEDHDNKESCKKATKIKDEPQSDEDEDACSSTKDWSKSTIAELREACKERGIDSTGNKAALVRILDGHKNESGDKKAVGIKIKAESAEDDDACSTSKDWFKSTAGTKAAPVKKLDDDHENESDSEPPAKVCREDSRRTKLRKVFEALKDGPKEKVVHQLDSHCPMKDLKVYEDYDCMLNQTNIGDNNNKFYVIQLLHDTKKNSYFCWNRWGRVGEEGQTALKDLPSLEKAIQEFQKKFKDKTKNNWIGRDKFVSYPGKYTLIEVTDMKKTNDVITKKEKTCGEIVPLVPSKMDMETQELVKIIFDKDMFQNTMRDMNLDLQKMPLGNLSKQQIAKGFEALDELEQAIQNKKPVHVLNDLSSRFYTYIPHNFGRNPPVCLKSVDDVNAKKEMLMVLADIELAQALQQESEKTEKINPLDAKFERLRCNLELLDEKKHKEEYKMIQQYITATGSGSSKLINAWRMNREGESDRYSQHDKLGNRKLLWHGTTAAVVVAILKQGLRIMTSIGLVGGGLYFASEQRKSLGYVGAVYTGKRSIGFMFLNEVALGKGHQIVKRNYHQKAPPGFQSCIARGRTEPDPRDDIEVTMEGRKVMIPQGKPLEQPQYEDSEFTHSEYVVYDESQVRMRYLIEVSMYDT